MIDYDKQPGELIGKRLRVHKVVSDGSLSQGVYQVVDHDTGWPVVTLPLFSVYDRAYEAARLVSDPKRKRPGVTAVLD